MMKTGKLKNHNTIVVYVVIAVESVWPGTLLLHTIILEAYAWGRLCTASWEKERWPDAKYLAVEINQK